MQCENELINESYEDNKLKLDMEVNQRRILEELLSSLKKSENENKATIDKMTKEKEQLITKINNKDQMLTQMKTIIIKDESCQCQELMELLEMT